MFVDSLVRLYHDAAVEGQVPDAAASQAVRSYLLAVSLLAAKKC